MAQVDALTRRRAVVAAARGVPSSRKSIGGLLDAEGSVLEAQRSFPHAPFILRHALADHPACTAEALLDLCERLPTRSIRYDLGRLPTHLQGRTPGNGLSAPETLAQIETCKSWLNLHHIEEAPGHALLVNEIVDGLCAFARRSCPPTHAARGITGREAHVHVASPWSTSPVQIEAEHELLLQVRGTTTVHVWPLGEPDGVAETALEELVSSSTCDPTALAIGRTAPRWAHTLRPGDALYVPSSLPHQLGTSDEASVTVRAAWCSTASRRATAVRQVNARLRRRGIKPLAPGISPARDTLKSAALHTARTIKRFIGY